jgi:hypothetical protein
MIDAKQEMLPEVKLGVTTGQVNIECVRQICSPLAIRIRVCGAWWLPSSSAALRCRMNMSSFDLSVACHKTPQKALSQRCEFPNSLVIRELHPFRLKYVLV